MIDLGGELVDLNLVDGFGKSALQVIFEMFSAGYDADQFDKLELFLNRGANPPLGDEGGEFLDEVARDVTHFNWPGGRDYLMLAMKVIARAQAAKDGNKSALPEELYALGVRDDDGHTPLSRAINMCMVKQSLFRRALLECGLDKNIFPRAKKCPVMNVSRYCCCQYSEFWVLSSHYDDSSDDQDSPLDESQPTLQRGRDNFSDDQVVQGPSHWSAVLPSSSINIQDGTTSAMGGAAGSAPSASTATSNLPSVLELSRVADLGLQAIGQGTQLQPIGLPAATQHSPTANERLGSQGSSFQANILATEGAPLNGLWGNPYTANAMEELSDSRVWSRFTELDSNSVSLPFSFMRVYCTAQFDATYVLDGTPQPWGFKSTTSLTDLST